MYIMSSFATYEIDISQIVFKPLTDVAIMCSQKFFIKLYLLNLSKLISKANCHILF